MSSTSAQIGAVCLPALPLVAGVLGLLLPDRARRWASGVAIASASVAGLVAALFTLGLTTSASVGFAHPARVHATVARFGDLAVTSIISVDGLAAVIALMVLSVAVAVQVYSIGFAARDPRYATYAAQISLFTGAMLLVVCAGDWITLLVGWELMGLCSYLLIGHDRSVKDAPWAAMKAFVVTRVGDIGIVLGIVVAAVATGSLRIADTVGLSTSTTTAIFLLMFVGVVGKSAQTPLHTWLPDAMAGPTPVSALIHAATMVAAGVYVMARDFVFTEATGWVVVAVGTMTILLGALAACVATDLKRVLAWSTVSQLGYLVAAWHLDGFAGPALFHLITHAAFKSLLFLAAGALAYTAGTTSLERLGGVRHGWLSLTALAVGLAALAGVPPFSGFWSKDSIFSAASDVIADGSASGSLRAQAWLALVAGLAAVPITAFYAVRLWLRICCTGAARGGADGDAPQPPPRLPTSMRAVLVALLVPAALFGVLGAWLGWLSPHETSVAGARIGVKLFAPHLDTALASTALVALGGFVAWLMWRAAPAKDPARLVGPLRPIFAAGFYVDTVQHALVVRPAVALARVASRADAILVDGAVMGLARLVNSGGALGVRLQRGLARYVTLAAAGATVAVVVTAVIVATVGAGR